MLDRLLRQRTRPPDGPETSGDALRSHVFPRFLKRLSARERPAVLDLGRLSGGNIEIFARLGCRVQVEDLMRSAEEALAATPAQAPAAEPSAAAALPHIHETPAAARPAARAVAEPAPATGAASIPGPAGPNAAAIVPPAAAGGSGRPTRHIVLPPRVFGTSGARGVNGHSANGSNGTNGHGPMRPTAPITLPLPLSFSYPDESFDAIVGWDLFNYYDPEASKRLGADVVRLLRPGGIVFAFFHARREEAPDGPARHRIVDETHLHVEPWSGPPSSRHLYQNRDIEKTFNGLKIVELYFLRHGVREMLLEKRASAGPPPAIGGPARPRPRFRIE
jgi:SAM-dependent methyltransferase